MYIVGQSHHDRRMPVRWICSIHNLRRREGHAVEQGANMLHVYVRSGPRCRGKAWFF